MHEYLCFLTQLSSLSINDQQDIQLPYAMRDFPVTSQPGEQHRTPGHHLPFNHEPEGTGTATNGRLPSLPGTPPLPRTTPCNTTGSPIVPKRPKRVGSDSVFQSLPLRRQLVSQGSLDSPLSPVSRPRSPWGRFDPYDSPEVCFCMLMLSVQSYDECVNGLSFASYLSL